MSMVGFIHTILGLIILVSGAAAMMARKQHGWHRWLGEIYHWCWLLLALTGLWVGWHHPGLSIFEIITPPSYLAALVGYVAAKRRRTWRGHGWLWWHIQGLATSYISLVTALGFQIWPRVHEIFYTAPLLFWGWMILPALFAIPWVERTLVRWKQVPAKANRTPTTAAD